MFYPGEPIPGGLRPISLRSAFTRAVRLQPSTSYAQGCLLAESVSAPATYGPYDDGNPDLDIARAVSQFGCSTDADGNVTYDRQAPIDLQGYSHRTAVAWVKGEFRTEELYQTPGAGGGIDAAAVADLGRLLQGSITRGIISLS